MALALFAPRDAVATRGTAYANVVWAAQLVVTTAIGLVFLFSRHIQIGRVLAAGQAIESGLEAEEAEYQSGAGK